MKECVLYISKAFIKSFGDDYQRSMLVNIINDFKKHGGSVYYEDIMLVWDITDYIDKNTYSMQWVKAVVLCRFAKLDDKSMIIYKDKVYHSEDDVKQLLKSLNLEVK